MNKTTAVSDLFFNHEHRLYEEAYRQGEVETESEVVTTQRRVRIALAADAYEFWDAYGPIIEAFHPGVWSSRALTEDFLGRV